MYKHLLGAGKETNQTFLSGSQRSGTIAKQVLTDTQGILFKHKKKHYCCKNDKLWAVCWVSTSGVFIPGNIPNQPGHRSSQSKLILLWEGGDWTRSFPEGPLDSDSFVVLWFQKSKNTQTQNNQLHPTFTSFPSKKVPTKWIFLKNMFMLAVWHWVHTLSKWKISFDKL